MRTLVADRCTLEPQAPHHAPEMFQLLQDPALYEFENGPPASLDALTLRYQLLAAAQSPDGREHWLNWVLRLPSQALAGYVQATVMADGFCYVAYVLASTRWRQGIGRSAVSAMLLELATHYQVPVAVAVLKARNHRSLGLLLNLGFAPADAATVARAGPELDEIVMARPLFDRLHHPRAWPS